MKKFIYYNGKKKILKPAVLDFGDGEPGGANETGSMRVLSRGANTDRARQLPGMRGAA